MPPVALWYTLPNLRTLGATLNATSVICRTNREFTSLACVVIMWIETSSSEGSKHFDNWVNLKNFVKQYFFGNNFFSKQKNISIQQLRCSGFVIFV